MTSHTSDFSSYETCTHVRTACIRTCGRFQRLKTGGRGRPRIEDTSTGSPLCHHGALRNAHACAITLHNVRVSIVSSTQSFIRAGAVCDIRFLRAAMLGSRHIEASERDAARQ